MSQTSPFDHLPSFAPAQSGFTIICCLAVKELAPYKSIFFSSMRIHGRRTIVILFLHNEMSSRPDHFNKRDTGRAKFFFEVIQAANFFQQEIDLTPWPAKKRFRKKLQYRHSGVLVWRHIYLQLVQALANKVMSQPCMEGGSFLGCCGADDKLKLADRTKKITYITKYTITKQSVP